MKAVKEKFSILIPVHNEAKRIRRNLKEVKETLDNLGCNYEIVAIDDGSSDNSYQVLKELEKEIPQLIVSRSVQNFGKGRALKKAFKYASGDLIVWLDADLELHPQIIEGLEKKGFEYCTPIQALALSSTRMVSSCIARTAPAWTALPAPPPERLAGLLAAVSMRSIRLESPRASSSSFCSWASISTSSAGRKIFSLSMGVISSFMV